MRNHLQAIVSSIRAEIEPQFVERLRENLSKQNREWLIEQIVRMKVDSSYLEEKDTHVRNERDISDRRDRLERLKGIALNEEKLEHFLNEHQDTSRDTLIEDKYLAKNSPEKGTSLLTREHRSDQGNELLLRAKDILFALLYGEEEEATTWVKLDRCEQELLTLTLPRYKSHPLDFLKATTEINALGTWRDPQQVSNDSRADNIVLQVEYGEVEGELVGKGIAACLSLINNLEINEQVLYARMINVEQSTLIL